MLSVEIEWRPVRLLTEGSPPALSIVISRSNGQASIEDRQTLPQSLIDTFKGGVSIFDIIREACEPMLAVEAEIAAGRRRQAAAEEKRRRKLAARAIVMPDAEEVEIFGSGRVLH